MNKLKIELTNCFGIENLTHEFDFSTGNVFSIYARNGLMKTSFANTFQCLQRGKEGDICDKIFGHNGSASVRVDGDPICAEQIFVIKSFVFAIALFILINPLFIQNGNLLNRLYLICCTCNSS